MNKKRNALICCAVIALLSIFSMTALSSNVFAKNENWDDVIVKKALLTGVGYCYIEGAMSSNAGKLADLKSFENVIVGGESENFVALPTTFTGISDNDISCKGLIMGDGTGWGESGNFDGVFVLAGKPEYAKKFDYNVDKIPLMEGMGYRADADNGKKCIAFYFTTDEQGTQNGEYSHDVCYTDSKGLSIESQGNNTGSGLPTFVICDYAEVGECDGVEYGDTLQVSNGDRSVEERIQYYAYGQYGGWDNFRNRLKDLLSKNFSQQANGKWYQAGKERENNIGNGEYKLSIDDAKAPIKPLNYLSSYKQYSELAFTRVEQLDYYINVLKKYFYADTKDHMKCNISNESGYANYKKIHININTMERTSDCGMNTTSAIKDRRAYGFTSSITGGSLGGGLSGDELYFDVSGSTKLDTEFDTTLDFEELINAINALVDKMSDEELAEVSAGLDGQDEESDGQDEEPNSEGDPCYNAGVESMSWVLCPTLDNTNQTVDAIESQLRNWLQIETVGKGGIFQDEKGKNNIYTGWGIFRNIANVFLIIIFLVVIFSQLTGVGIDNYGIKKILPRLIAMAILINLSYVICQLAVDLSNILGVGLDNLMKGIGFTINGGNDPSTGFTLQDIAAKLLAVVAAGGVIGGIAVNNGGGGGVMLIVSLLLAALVALVAVLIFFVMLSARMIIVAVFVVIAPVAFALYILPNTQALFKKWWKIFEAALVVYPICGALYGASYIIKAIVRPDNMANLGFFQGMIGVVAPFLPFLILPSLLKGALAGLGALGGTLTMLGNGLRKGVQSGSGAIQSGIKGSERYKNSMQDRARNRQIKMMDRGIDRLQNKRRPLTGNEELRLARMQQTQDKLRNEDRAARAIVEQNRTKDMDLSGLSKEWNDAWEAGNKEKLDAMTSVINSRYGAAGANEIAKRIATKNIANDENSQSMMKVLQNNMNHDSTLANNMRNKASDAYGMISDGGKDGNGNYQNLRHFTDNNEIAKSDKDWSTQSSATLQRAIDSGRLTKEQIKRILNSSDTSIQSGLDDDKRKVLRDAVPEFTTPVQSTPITSGNAMTDEAEL